MMKNTKNKALGGKQKLDKTTPLKVFPDNNFQILLFKILSLEKAVGLKGLYHDFHQT
jgi:hypothetical protein